MNIVAHEQLMKAEMHLQQLWHSYRQNFASQSIF